jgi:hypothetical protein
MLKSFSLFTVTIVVLLRNLEFVFYSGNIELCTGRRIFCCYR